MVTWMVSPSSMVRKVGWIWKYLQSQGREYVTHRDLAMRDRDDRGDVADQPAVSAEAYASAHPTPSVHLKPGGHDPAGTWRYAPSVFFRLPIWFEIFCGGGLESASIENVLLLRGSHSGMHAQTMIRVHDCASPDKYSSRFEIKLFRSKLNPTTFSNVFSSHNFLSHLR